MGSNQFRSYVWDPVMILGQMITIQCIFYIFLGIWISTSDAIVDSPRSLDQIFSSKSVALGTTRGRLFVTALVLNALTSALGLWYVVKRTKQCLDFAATAHLIHLVFCWFYSGAIPSAPSWWVAQILCIALMTVLGEYLCMRTELKAIPVSIGGLASSLGVGPKSDL